MELGGGHVHRAAMDKESEEKLAREAVAAGLERTQAQWGLCGQRRQRVQRGQSGLWGQRAQSWTALTKFERTTGPVEQSAGEMGGVGQQKSRAW